MKKLIGLIAISISLFALDLTYTKAFKEYQKGKKYQTVNPELAKKHYQNAFFLLNSIKDSNSSQTHFLLGEMYAKGLGVEQNFSLAEQHFLKAIKLGNKRAYCCLAKLYLLEGKKDLAKKYLNIALSNNNTSNYCKDIENTQTKEKK